MAAGHGLRPADGGFMSINRNNVLVTLVVAGFTLASASASAQDNSPNGYDDRYEGSEGIFDYAKVVDVQPLTTRVRVSTPQRECWDETRYEQPRYGEGMPRSVAGGTLLGAALGAVIGHQIGDGNGRKA